MRADIKDRVLAEARLILKTEQTIRMIATIFGVSKSTVHKDLQERLRLINKRLHNDVNKILKYHIDVRHIRGGQSTKMKYLRIKN